MAISVGGLVSGIDTQNVISQLLDLERQPILKLQRQEAAYQVRLTSYGSLRSALSNLRTATAALDAPSDFNQFTGVSSNTNSFTASVFSTAVSGSTSIEVHSLAQVHKLKSEAFGVDETVGEGTFNLQLGEGESVEISTSAEDTLADVALKINEARKGVTAAVITDGDNAYLTLTGQNTGEDNIIRLEVTSEDPPGGLSRLQFIAGGEDNGLTQTQAASDAVLTVDGVENIRRSTNTVADVIKGVTLTLKGTTEEGKAETLTVSRDTGAAATKINAFVDAYNSVTDFFKSAQSYDPETKQAGILQGDGTANLIRNRLRNMVAGFVPGGSEGLSRLSDLGVTIDKEGKLNVDSSKLNDALQARFDDVTAFFSADSGEQKGFGVGMVNLLDSMLNTNTGELAARTKGIETSVTRINKDIGRFETRISRTEARLQAQFQNLERVLAQYQQTGDFLSQQIAGLQSMNQAISRGR